MRTLAHPDLGRIELRGLRVFAHHGVRDHEKTDGQPFVLDLTLWADLRDASISDRLEDTVNYAEVAQRVRHVVASTRFDLIERVAGEVIDAVLDDSVIHAVEVRVVKPHAPVGVDLEHVAVTMFRERSLDEEIC